MSADDVVNVLVDLFMVRGVPVHIRSDNGGEFIAKAIGRLAAITGLKMLYIALANPWENGFAESFQQPPARRALERGGVSGCARGKRVGRDVEERVQPPQAAQQPQVRAASVIRGRAESGCKAA